MAQRDEWLDVAKGIGIILVVLGHVLRGLHSAQILTSPDYGLWDSVIYSFHMPLFFFLSGVLFLGSWERHGVKRFLAGKFDTLVYPYIIWSLMQGTIEVFLSKYTNGATRMSDVLALLVAPRAQFWFLYALFFVFIFYAMFLAVFKRIGLWLACALALVGYLFQVVLSGMPVVAYIAVFALFFGLGSAFSLVARTIKLPSLVFYVVLIAFIPTQWLFHVHGKCNYQDTGWASLGLALLGIGAVVAISMHLPAQVQRGLVRLGRASMAIYILHILCVSGIRIVLKKFLGVDFLPLHLVLGWTCGIAIPLLLLHLFDKYNIRNVFSAPVALSLLEWWQGRSKSFHRG